MTGDEVSKLITQVIRNDVPVGITDRSVLAVKIVAILRHEGVLDVSSD